MRRLSDLSDIELAPLFNMTVPEVRRYRNPPPPVLFEDVVIDEESRAEKDRYDRWLWNLPVEEFKRLRESDDPDTYKPFVAPVPFDVAGRFRALQDLLQNEPEFEARYPAAFEVLYPNAARRRERRGLYLPSFDVRILNNWTLPHVRREDGPGGADAYTSVSRWWQKDWRLHEADHDIDAPQYDDLQGVLLAVLGREEYGERVEVLGRWYRSGDVEGVSGPEEAPIRLTDLRLAGLVPGAKLKNGLGPVLDLLHQPLSADRVVLWKLRVLGSDPEWVSGTAWSSAKHLAQIPAENVPEDARELVREVGAWYRRGDRLGPPETMPATVRMRRDLLIRQFGDEKKGVMAVSFAAAALWLFLDLDMPGIERASSYRLSEQIESLASLVRKAAQRLERSTVRPVPSKARRRAFCTHSQLHPRHAPQGALAGHGRWPGAA